jgi:asparagine synthase (glutamine-hydrolysing)
VIFSVLGPEAPATMDRLLRSASGGDGTGTMRVARLGRAAIGADTRVPTGYLDEEAGLAWVGSVRPTGGLLAAPASLRGDYGLIAFGESELVLARGRFGGRPLFYTWALGPKGRSLVVSSRLEPLVKLLPDRPRLDLGRLAGALVRAVPRDHSQTYYAGIFRVPCATILRIDENQVRASTSIPFRTPARHAPSPDELAESLSQVILASVARTIEGKSRVGVLASGGLDSSAVLAAALRTTGLRSRRIEALNIEFAADGDDRPHFAALCRALGVEGIRIPPEEGARLWRRSFVIDAAPYADGSQIGCMIRLVELARERGTLDLVLTGDGGDPLFDGDPRVFAARAKKGDVLGAVRAAWALRAIGRSSARQRIDHFVVRPILRGLVPATIRRAWYARDNPAPRWAGPVLQRFLREDVDATELEPEGETPNSEVRVARIASSGVMTEGRDQRGQLEIAMNCDCADPLFDDDLGEWVAATPPELLFHGGQRRGLFRHALRGLVPDSVRLRDDKSRFELALTRQVAALGGFESLRPLAEARTLGDLGLVEPGRVLEDFDALARSPENGRLWTVVWPILTVEAFAAQYEGGDLP